MLLAWDDTDDAAGGCTTHTLFAVLQALPGLAPRGMPRLVRLNPNVPWKTRGNAAVSVELVQLAGPSTPIGEWRGFEVHAYPEGPAASADPELLDAAWAAIQAEVRPGAEPAIALFEEPPPPAAYWEAVTTRVDPDAARKGAEGFAVAFRGSDRALAGCLGAAGWPGPASSYELIAYRDSAAWGTPRAIDPAPLRSLDATGATFHSWDPEADRPACIPKTPCPVLCGLRGRDPEALRFGAVHALATAAQEPIDAWMLWATNQASGDHVVPVADAAEAPPWSTVEVEATVTGPPEARQGGHVFVPMDGFEAAAFEPTKGFRQVVEALQPGDRVVATGAFANGVVRLEKLAVVEAPRRVRPSEHCGRPMQSVGAGAGWRCRECGATVAEVVEASWVVGPHEVPVMARRHLHRPMGWPQGP